MKEAWFEKMRKVFAATAFAEMDERQSALEIGEIEPGPAKQPGFGLERVFAAAAFAEEGCHEHAREVLGKRPTRSPRSLDTFLDTVGLRNASVCYGLARL